MDLDQSTSLSRNKAVELVNEGDLVKIHIIAAAAFLCSSLNVYNKDEDGTQSVFGKPSFRNSTFILDDVCS